MTNMNRIPNTVTAGVSVPVGMRLHELPALLEDLCARLAGAARSSRLTGGELSLALEGLDQTRRITVSVDECDGGIFADALTRHLISTPVPGCLRRLTLSLSPEAESHAPAEKRMPTGIAARLQARLGPGRVFRLSGLETGLPAPSPRLSPVSDAFVRRPVTGSAPSDPRPALILSEPIPLHDSENGPRWQQEALHLVSGPVQQADDGVVRDYFVAESSGGRRVWLYRTTESGRPGANWHLQGLFA